MVDRHKTLHQNYAVVSCAQVWSWLQFQQQRILSSLNYDCKFFREMGHITTYIESNKNNHNPRVKISTSDVAHFHTTGNWWMRFPFIFRSGHEPTYCSCFNSLVPRKQFLYSWTVYSIAWEVWNRLFIVLNRLPLSRLLLHIRIMMTS